MAQYFGLRTDSWIWGDLGLQSQFQDSLDRKIFSWKTKKEKKKSSKAFTLYIHITLYTQQWFSNIKNIEPIFQIKYHTET